MKNSITLLTTHVSRGRLDDIGMGDPNFTVELIDIMIEDGSQRVQKLRTAHNLQHFEEVGKIAHSLKGAALNVGAMTLAQLCAEIDETIRSLSEAITPEQVALVEAEFTSVVEELKQIKSEITA